MSIETREAHELRRRTADTPSIAEPDLAADPSSPSPRYTGPKPASAP